MEGIKGLVGTSAPLMDEAIGLTKGLTDQFTAEEAQKYMSPYQQAVTDIEKREAQKVFERDIMPQFEKQAVEAGGMSGMGSRAGIQAAQLGQAQMQQLGDIQTKGSQRAYEDALRQFQNQKERERLAASGLMEAGPKSLRQVCWNREHYKLLVNRNRIWPRQHWMKPILNSYRNNSIQQNSWHNTLVLLQ